MLGVLLGSQLLGVPSGLLPLFWQLPGLSFWLLGLLLPLRLPELRARTLPLFGQLPQLL
jgi:hypothetical protein